MRAQAYQKAKDPTQEFYANQKRTMEINPRHPLVKELKRRVDSNKDDQTTKDLATVLFETATLRSGYVLPDTAGFSDRIERMLRLSMDISLDEKVDEEPEDVEEKDEDEKEVDAEDAAAEKKEQTEEKKEGATEEKTESTEEKKEEPKKDEL